MMREVALSKVIQNTQEPRVIGVSISKGCSWYRGGKLGVLFPG